MTQLHSHQITIALYCVVYYIHLYPHQFPIVTVRAQYYTILYPHSIYRYSTLPGPIPSIPSIPFLSSIISPCFPAFSKWHVPPPQRRRAASWCRARLGAPLVALGGSELRRVQAWPCVKCTVKYCKIIRDQRLSMLVNIEKTIITKCGCVWKCCVPHCTQWFFADHNP